MDDPKRAPGADALADTVTPDHPTLATTPASPALPSEDLVGHVLGRYRVLARLGAGGMGAVYAALDTELDRKVALKVLLPLAKERSADLEARLRREAQALARLDHPNVVRVYDVGSDAGRVFVAMQLIEGTNLGDLIANERPPVRRVLELFVDAGRGLAAAHDAGIVHRDVKPSNILVDRAARAYVGDFGLARSAGADTAERDATRSGNLLDAEMTHEGSVLGTPRYMSPEQFNGEAVTARSDQFSFCVSLWESLFGRHPFVDKWAWGAVIDAISADRVADPPAVRGVPARVVQALRRGMRSAPDARWPSMADLVDVLMPRSRRKAAWIGAAAAGMLGVAAVTALAMRGTHTSPMEACVRAADRVAAVWPARQAELHQKLVTAGLASEEPALVKAIAAYADEWHDLRRDACIATDVRGSGTPVLRDMQLRCLDQDLALLGDVVDELRGAPPERLVRGVQMIRALPELDACATETLAQIPPPPPGDIATVYAIRKQLETARTYEQEGRREEAEHIAIEQLDAAKRLGYGPLTAQALQLRALLYADLRETFLAADMAGQAAEQAIVSHDDRTAARAYALQLVQAAKKPDLAQVATLIPIARAAATRVGDPVSLAVFEHAAGAGETAAARFDEALAHCQRALELAAKVPSGGEHFATRAYSCLTVASAGRGDFASAARWVDAWVDGDRKLYGPSSLGMIESLQARAMVRRAQGKFDEALAIIRDVLERIEHALGPDTPILVDPLETYAQMLHQSRHIPEGLEAARRALAIVERTDSPPGISTVLAHTTLAQLLKAANQRPEMYEHYQAALAVAENVLAPDSNQLATVRWSYGGALAEGGKVDEGLALVAKAADTWARTKSPRLPAAQYQRAEILGRHDRCAEAVPLYDEAIAGLSREKSDASMLVTAKYEDAACRWEAKLDRSRAIELMQEVAREGAALGAAGKNMTEAAQQFVRAHPKP